MYIMIKQTPISASSDGGFQYREQQELYDAAVEQLDDWDGWSEYDVWNRINNFMYYGPCDSLLELYAEMREDREIEEIVENVPFVKFNEEAFLEYLTEYDMRDFSLDDGKIFAIQASAKPKCSSKIDAAEGDDDDGTSVDEYLQMLGADDEAVYELMVDVYDLFDDETAKLELLRSLEGETCTLIDGGLHEAVLYLIEEDFGIGTGSYQRGGFSSRNRRDLFDGIVEFDEDEFEKYMKSKHPIFFDYEGEYFYIFDDIKDVSRFMGRYR